jgi:hypothetical protein
VQAGHFDMVAPLGGTKRQKIEDEYQAVMANIAYLEDLLAIRARCWA